MVISLVQLLSVLLHSECRHKLHAITVAYAEIAPSRGLHCAHVSAGIPLCVGGDVGQVRARGGNKQAAYRGAERVIGRRTTQCDMRSRTVHNNGSAAGSISGRLLNSSCHSSRRQQR